MRVRTRARRKPKDAYHHGDLREALLEAAMAFLEEHGVEGVTVRRIASRLGVSHAAPAHHFPTRDALLGALAGRGYEELGRAMEVARRGAAAGRALPAIGLAYVRFALDHPNLFRLMFGGVSAGGAGCDTEGLAAAQRCQAILREAVAEACPPIAAPPSPDVERSGLHRSALASWALVHGLATLWIERQIEDFFQGPGAQSEFLGAVEAILR